MSGTALCSTFLSLILPNIAILYGITRELRDYSIYFLYSDLPYRKKQEQASKRGAVKERKEHGQVSEFGDARAAQQEGLGEV